MFNLPPAAAPARPTSLPDAPADFLAFKASVDAKQTQPGTFERDAFDYSGQRSVPLAKAHEGPGPVATSVVSPDIKEDESQKTYESLSGVATGIGATVSKVAGTVVPLALASGFLNSNKKES